MSAFREEAVRLFDLALATTRDGGEDDRRWRASMAAVYADALLASLAPKDDGLRTKQVSAKDMDADRVIVDFDAPAQKVPAKYEPKVGDVVRYGEVKIDYVVTRLASDFGGMYREKDGSWRDWFAGGDCPGIDCRYLRPATPAERIAAGLDKATPATGEAKEWNGADEEALRDASVLAAHKKESAYLRAGYERAFQDGARWQFEKGRVKS